MIDNRIRHLNNNEIYKEASYVLYWMQQSQRIEYNHALAFAIEKANNLKLPLIVAFTLTTYPEANERHYTFMLQGLKELALELQNRNIKFILKIGNPIEEIKILSKEASLLVSDKAYLKIQRYWREEIAKQISISMIEIESDLVVPIETASNKEEYAAYTIRKKIHNHLEDNIFSFDIPKIKISSLSVNLANDYNENIASLISKLDISKTVKESKYFLGGYSQAKKLLYKFIEDKLDSYNINRNNASLDGTSNLSPYLHFGQISPIEIALEIKKENSNFESKASFLEELIVRRELAFNYCYYNENYDSYKGLKANWIIETLAKHKNDERLYLYTKEEFEKALTHDKIWNACQKELVISGNMQGYMRMYWGKKIIEWSSSPEEAFEVALYLNNKYALDGRDANSYTGIAWCFGKHDRPWFERNIFGKVRYMNESGLKKRFKIEDYINKVESLEK